MIYVVLIFLLGAALLAGIINLPVHVAVKFALGAAAMYGISKLLAQRLKIKDEFGMLMVRSQSGIGLINQLARNEEMWKLFADLGIVVAYGAAAFFIIKRPLKQKAAVLLSGLVLLTVLSFIVLPFVFPFMLGILGGSGENINLGIKTSNSGLAYLSMGLLYIGGFALTAFASLLTYTSVILSALIGTLFFGTGAMSKTAPGATVIIPGVNIPLLEGVAALALILLVHEGGHAVLARVAKVRIQSSGIVLFGIVPIGAFVEPDEEALKKVDNYKQTRVMVAGSTANFFSALALFVVFLAFIALSSPYKESGIMLVGGNMSGSIVYRINGEDAAQFLNSSGNQTKLNSTLVFEGSAGTYETRIGKEGIRYYDLSASSFVARYTNPALMFMYNLLGLAFTLNFIIGMVNLLPLPFFDGYRLVEINVDNKMLVTALSLIAALAFLINFLPWIF